MKIEAIGKTNSKYRSASPKNLNFLRVTLRKTMVLESIIEVIKKIWSLDPVPKLIP